MHLATRLLSRRAHSRNELRRKLARSGEMGQIEEVLNRLEELRLLNDADYAYNFALCRMRQDGWGPLKVLQSLQRRQVAMDVAESALARVRAEIDDRFVLLEYLKQHHRKDGPPQDRKGILRLVSHLRRRGFGDETIFSALRQIIPTAAWQHLETGD